MRWSNGFLSSFNWRELKCGVLSRTPNVIQARPRGYPEQNTALLLHPAITWMQSAFYLLLTLTHTEIIFKDPLLASKIGWFYKVFWLYICLYVYIQWYYTNQLTLPSTLVFQSASPILTCFLCMAQYVLSTGSLSVQSCCKSPRSRMLFKVNQYRRRPICKSVLCR